MAAKKEETTYTKQQLVESNKYKQQIDLVNALLVDGKSYTIIEVDKIISDFKKGKVK